MSASNGNRRVGHNPREQIIETTAICSKHDITRHARVFLARDCRVMASLWRQIPGRTGTAYLTEPGCHKISSLFLLSLPI